MPDDTGRAVMPAARRDLTAGPRHRRPPLLVRSGQAVAGRISALARNEPDPGPAPSAHLGRYPAMTVRRYWT
ncbi:MAG TPA: hypothetical protein VHU92_14620 [Streptosporangiaceae bacterium]|nr:hypothetical protein [Streptosporangiaceae bacterium]